MSTATNKELRLVTVDNESVYDIDLDEIFEKVFKMSLYELVHAIEHSPITALEFVCNIYYNAIRFKDINAITTIIKRVEGLPVSKDDETVYDTIFSDRVKQVMNMSKAQRNKDVQPSDEVGLCIAKALVSIAFTGGKVYRDQAYNLILDYTQGRRTKPNEQTRQIEVVLPSLC
jgi:hypothetical protein